MKARYPVHRPTHYLRNARGKTVKYQNTQSSVLFIFPINKEKLFEWFI